MNALVRVMTRLTLFAVEMTLKVLGLLVEVVIALVATMIRRPWNDGGTHRQPSATTPALPLRDLGGRASKSPRPSSPGPAASAPGGKRITRSREKPL